jgi:tetratricopeptide (TPR) repeat protein
VKAALLFLALYQAAPNAQQAYEQANRLFTERKFQESMNSLDEALRLDPKLVPALTLRAKLAMAINRYDVAKESLERAIAAAPNAWYPQFLYGYHYYQQNEMPAAIDAFQKARKLNPRHPQSALYLGLAVEALGRTTEALPLYQTAIKLEEDAGNVDVETLLTTSRLLLLLGRLDESGRLIQRAAKLDPASRDPHFEAARLYLKQGAPAKAAAEGETALKIPRGDITDRQIHFLLVRAYRAAGDDPAAAKHAAALRSLDQC